MKNILIFLNKSLYVAVIMFLILMVAKNEIIYYFLLISFVVYCLSQILLFIKYRKIEAKGILLSGTLAYVLFGIIIVFLFLLILILTYDPVIYMDYL